MASLSEHRALVRRADLRFGPASRAAAADIPLGSPLSVSASAPLERGSVVLTYVDIVLVVVVAVPALALGAPTLGYVVGAAAWIVQRLASVELDRRLAVVPDMRRRLGLGVASAMARVWVLAATIMIVGVTATRADGLTAALVIFGAFSLNFARSAIAHMTQSRRTTA